MKILVKDISNIKSISDVYFILLVSQMKVLMSFILTFIIPNIHFLVMPFKYSV